MPGELFEIEGEKKKRVVRADFLFFLSLLLQVAFSPTPSPHAQCYFFDSDVGGFHYGPGHPYVPVFDNNHSILKRALFFPCVVLA
jgi:histone deacetylase 1/2